MKLLPAAVFAAGSILGLACCGRQAPPKNQSGEISWEGILEDKNDHVIVVRSRKGRERMFWLREGITCDACCGETVRVSYGETAWEGNPVPTVISVSKP